MPDHEQNLEEMKAAFKMEWNRPVPEEYDQLSRRANFVPLPWANYSNRLSWAWGDGVQEESEPPATREMLRSLIAGKNFVDLGCGIPSKSVAGSMVAEKAGAKRYIGIEKQFLEGDDGGISDMDVKNGMPRVWLKEDMLKGLARFEKLDGVVFFIAGIEGIPGDEVSSEALQKYFAHVTEEITRLTKPGDAVILVGSDLTGFLLSCDKEFTRLVKENFRDRSHVGVFIRQ